MTDTPKPQPEPTEPLICRQYDVLVAVREWLTGETVPASWKLDDLIAAARPLVEAIRSGDVTAVKVVVGIWPNGTEFAQATTERPGYWPAECQATRATVYARKPRPVEVSEGISEATH